MAKRTEKTKCTVKDAVEACSRRDSDLSDEDPSDVESYVSEIDSVAEDMFREGQDDAQTADSESDPEWEPGTILGKALVERTDDICAEQTTDSDTDTEPGPSLAKIPRKRGRCSGRGRGATTTLARASGAAEERWHGVDEPDITPTKPIFCPLRKPGCQLITTGNYSVLELFQLFFTNAVIRTLVNNTNQNGRATQTTTSNPWTDITVQDFFAFISIVVYMGFMKARALTDYWRQGALYSLPFPKKVITGRKFFSISRALHLSSSEDDAANEARRGTSSFDRLGKIKPLYIDIRDACRSNFQPGQHIAIDERMVASKARVLFKQYVKRKPVKWGFKLFVLADSETGYTWDFFVYEGKNTENTGKGLSYDSVMKLIDTSLLGTGYKLYVDNFYTSPTLFRDLLQQKIWACGTIRTNTVGYPKTTNNTLDQKSPRGDIRWIRKDPLLFIQWRDTRDVFLCSTMHTAHGEETVERKMKDGEGQWTVKDVAIPPAVKDYNKHMGGVDLSDALIGYYDVLHKTKKWYKTFFFHFLDIAIVNAFILHKQLCKEKGQIPMTQKAFRETLALELSGVGSQQSPLKPEVHRKRHHMPVYMGVDGTSGRRRCRRCQSKTPLKCATCDVPLCFVPSRDCYNEWHVENNL